MRRRTLLRSAPAVLCAPGVVLAQSAYPNKPIRYIARWTKLAKDRNIRLDS